MPSSGFRIITSLTLYLAAIPEPVRYRSCAAKARHGIDTVAFERACGKKLPYQIVGRRPGDSAESYADPTLANRELGWVAERDLDTMCADTWRWQQANPYGFS